MKLKLGETDLVTLQKSQRAGLRRAKLKANERWKPEQVTEVGGWVTSVLDSPLRLLQSASSSAHSALRAPFASKKLE